MTTDEMDGLFTDEDKANRYNMYYQCTKKGCFKWNFIKGDGIRTSLPTIACNLCGGTKFDTEHALSQRSFMENRDKLMKRRPSAKIAYL